MAPKKFSIIANPFAGKLDVKDRVSYLTTELKRSNLLYKTYYTNAPLHAHEIAKDVSKKSSAVLVVGGDGTINEVISGMMECGGRAKIGIIPSGSGNDLIKPLLISQNIEKSVSTIINGTAKKIDVGRCNDRYFINIMGVGFDAAVGARMHYLRCNAKTKKGKSFYSKALFHTIMHYKSIPLKVKVDGKKYGKKYFLVSIANGTTFGGDFVIAPMADICDGSLCLVSIESISKLRFFMHLNKVKKGKVLTVPEVDYTKCKKVSIRSDTEIAAQLDGEYYCAKEFDISVIPGGLEVFVPSKL